jgi:small subunit ribosomal protein S5
MGMLCGGAAPLGLGDGFGGPGRRADKGAGMRSIREIEWARGKRIRETQRL